MGLAQGRDFSEHEQGVQHPRPAATPPGKLPLLGRTPLGVDRGLIRSGASLELDHAQEIPAVPWGEGWGGFKPGSEGFREEN